METFLIKKRRLSYLMLKKNYDYLKESDKDRISDFVKKYSNNYIFFSLTNLFAFIFLKKIIINKIQNKFLKHTLEFTSIMALISCSKILFDSKKLSEISHLDQIMTKNSYLIKNSIVFKESIDNISNKDLNRFSLFIYNLDNYTQINLFTLIIIRLII